jgi:uracil-DNA glycosylase
MKETNEPPGFPAQFPSTSDLSALHSVMKRCTRCDLFLSRTQVVPGSGDEVRGGIMLVGEAPGATEDRDGVPFVGRSGALLEQMLAEAGLSREDVFVANVIRCRPPENRNPKPAELRACAGWMERQVGILRPRLVVTLGRFALQHFIPGGGITALQGEALELEYGTATVVVFPLLHPSAILRNPKSRAAYAALFRKLGILASG